jgi:hypothetical protein
VARFKGLHRGCVKIQPHLFLIEEIWEKFGGNKKRAYLCGSKMKKTIMARPIKETPSTRLSLHN